MKNLIYSMLCAVLFMSCELDSLPPQHVDEVHYDLSSPKFLKMVTKDNETQVSNGEAYDVSYIDNGDNTFELVFTAPFQVEEVLLDIYNGETSYVMWSEVSEDYSQYTLRGGQELLKQPVETFKFTVVYYGD